MFQAILLIIFISLVIGGIVSVVQYFKTETKSSTPTPTVKDSAPTATLTAEVSPQITDSVTLPIGGASANANAEITLTPKPKNKKKKYYYKPKAAKSNKPVARLKGSISEANRIKKQRLGK